LRSELKAASYEKTSTGTTYRAALPAVPIATRNISPRQGARDRIAVGLRALNDLISEEAERDLCITLEARTSPSSASSRISCAANSTRIDRSGTVPS
jgi:hypothetical protein